MIQMNNLGLMTIDRFNKLTGHETLHPLICMVDLSKANLTEDIRMMCNFYGLLYYNDSEQEKASEKSGYDWFIPAKRLNTSNRHRHTGYYSGVLFHPDLLCDTSLENRIETYPKRCCCKGALSEHERRIITDNLREIGEELHHAIDRHSATIIASHIELLLNYCVRFAVSELQNRNNILQTVIHDRSG